VEGLVEVKFAVDPVGFGVYFVFVEQRVVFLPVVFGFD
jgi:hypothetical protein